MTTGDAPLLWLPLAAAAAGALSGAASADRGAPADQRQWLTCNRRVSIWPFAWGKAIGREWKAGVCLPMNSWWSPPPAIAAVTCRPPRRRSPPAILFFHGVWNAWCSQAGLEKPIVPAGLRLNDSNLVLEAVRLGPAWRWSGAPGGGGDSPRRAGAAHRRHRPLPWHYWLTVSPQAENRPEVARFIAWLEEEIALWRQQISV